MAAAIVMVSIYPLQTPIWALCLSVFMGLVFLLPCGVIAATTNTVLGLNVGASLRVRLSSDISRPRSSSPVI